MPDVKISELPAATTIGGADLFEIVQSGTNKQMTASVLDTRYAALSGAKFTGSVGVGSDNPLAKIQVQNTIGAIPTQTTGGNHAFASDTTSIVLASFTGNARFAVFGANGGYDINFAGPSANLAAPSYPSASSNMGTFRFRAWDINTSSWVNGALITAIAEAGWSSSVRNTAITYSTANGTTIAERLRVTSLGALVMSNNTAKIFTPSGHLVQRNKTLATLPTATDVGETIYVTDAAGGAVTATWDGTKWARNTDLSDVTAAPPAAGGGGALELVYTYTIPAATTVSEIVFDQFTATPGVYIIEFEHVQGDGNLGMAMQYRDETSYVTNYTYECTGRIISSVEPLLQSSDYGTSFIKINPDDPFGDTNGWPMSGSIAFLVTSEGGKHGTFPCTWECILSPSCNVKGFGCSEYLSVSDDVTRVRLYNHRTPAVFSAGTFRLYRKQITL